VTTVPRNEAAGMANRTEFTQLTKRKKKEAKKKEKLTTTMSCIGSEDHYDA
jgi:hypothetical protein